MRIGETGGESVMEIREILKALQDKHITDQPYEVFLVDNTCYFGKDCNNNVVFMIPSRITKVMPICQETRSLRFAFNKKCVFKSEDKIVTRIVHLFTCKEKDEEKILAFIRLTKAFSQSEFDEDQLYLAKLFSSISALFDKERKVSESELQGLFAELYTILYLGEAGCNIAKFWQSRNRMKFDFSFTENKRLEIKSTLKSTRVHHFKHDQLLSELYDIKIVSVMFRKSDFGLSLQELVDKIRDKYVDNFILLMHVETAIANVDKDMLYGIKYDEIYLKENLRYFDAKNVPHCNEKTPEGVFNAEYDCCLDTVPTFAEEELINWIKEDD